jgi:hypothetical protein
MAVGRKALPFGFDPLIAEAKRRMKRRRALVLVLSVAVAGTALGVAFAVRGGPSEGPSASPFSTQRGGTVRSPGVNIGSGPFLLSGSLFDINGFKGDLSPFRKEASLGCFNNRHFADAFGIKNRSHAPVTLLSARAPGSAPGIAERVATQFLLSPPPYHGPTYHGSMGDAAILDPLVRRDWSAAATRPLTIPPGRIATVQSNFAFRHCGRLAGGRFVGVPGSVALSYRASGLVRQKVIPLSGLAFMVIAGPSRRTCAVPGAMSAVSSDTSCAATRRAALACHPLSHESWGDCTSANVLWDCGSYAGHRETCWQGPQSLRAHWFRVRWKPAST